MLKQSVQGIFQSTLMSAPHVVHGYSSRSLGDMRRDESIQSFCTLLKINPYELIQPEQVHGGRVCVVQENDAPGTVLGADGLVYKGKTPRVLGVLAADCVPILAVDPIEHVVGVAHAGWKGTLAGICQNLIDTMKSVGATSENIRVSIGPHIGACCYSVPEDRARQFLDMYTSDPIVTSKINGSMHLDLGLVNMMQLLASGISKDHIDAPIICTSCQADAFYSFRKDTKETFGEIVGVIGYVN